jgi:translation initiation factor 2 beta subunit (eIF-2beta)/eIF-5
MNAKDDRYIVNGAHDCEKLQNLLDGFIKRFVLCPNCDNPETKLVRLVFFILKIDNILLS